MGMGDLNIKIRVRNNRILRRVRDRFSSVAQMCREFGISQQQANALICFRETPFRKDGALRETADILCSALNATADDLWPDQMAEMRVTGEICEFELSAFEAMAICENPDEAMAKLQFISRWAGRLSQKERFVLGERFCGSTLEDVAKRIGAQRERARQIEAMAIRKMKFAAKKMDAIESYTQVIE